MNLGTTHPRRARRGAVVTALLLVAAALGLVNPSAAQAAGGRHYILVGGKVLAEIADGRIAVSPRQVEAKLYADPMQPGTGLGAVFPAGFGVPVINFVSPGPGRTSYNGIRFIRYCIETDGVCDNRSPLESIGGYIIQHPRYFPKFLTTITDGAYTNGNWFLPRQG